MSCPSTPAYSSFAPLPTARLACSSGEGRSAPKAVSANPALPLNSWPMAIGAVLMAPLWEDVFFRGFLLTSLATYMPLPAALLLTSLLFGLGHGHLWLPCTLTGLLFGVAYVDTGNLLAPIALHFVINASSVAIAFGCTDDNGSSTAQPTSSTANGASGQVQ